MIYLDSNATTRPDDAVVRAMNDALVERWQNPSSMHRAGQSAKALVEKARQSVARLINAEPGEIVLTSGGTEAIDFAIRGGVALGRHDGRTVVVSTPIEHAVARYLLRALEREGAIELREAPVTRAGVLDLARLEPLLDARVAVVNVQWANNETGAVQPVQRVGALVRSRCPSALFHVDGCQWVGKTPTDVRSSEPRAGGSMIDLLSIAAQKFHGPKGAGALFVRKGVPLPTQVHGSQESGRRGGTENVPGIAGMGVACDLARRWLEDPANLRRVGALRDRFERSILERVRGSVVNAGASERLENTSNIAFPGADAEAVLLTLSERGVCASAGAACSSGSMEPSPILRAMGVPPDLAMGSVRFSLSRETTEREVDEAVGIVVDVVESVRASAPLLRL